MCSPAELTPRGVLQQLRNGMTLADAYAERLGLRDDDVDVASLASSGVLRVTSTGTQRTVLSAAALVAGLATRLSTSSTPSLSPTPSRCTAVASPPPHARRIAMELCLGGRDCPLFAHKYPQDVCNNPTLVRRRCGACPVSVAASDTRARVCVCCAAAEAAGLVVQRQLRVEPAATNVRVCRSRYVTHAQLMVWIDGLLWHGSTTARLSHVMSRSDLDDTHMSEVLDGLMGRQCHGYRLTCSGNECLSARDRLAVTRAGVCRRSAECTSTMSLLTSSE
jgi:hypothetical protein